MYMRHKSYQRMDIFRLPPALYSYLLALLHHAIIIINLSLEMFNPHHAPPPSPLYQKFE